MASIPYMPLYISDYMADAAHLSTVEHGAYLLLIMTYWQKGEPFRANDERTLNERLARVVRMSNEEWERIRPTIAEFFQINATEWSHKRIEIELSKFRDKSDKAKAAGKASAQRRLNGRSTDVQRTFNHTDTDTDTDTEEKIKPSCAEQAPAPAVEITFPLVGEGEYHVTTSQSAEWGRLFPAVDVRQELREMRAWLQANPKRRKKESGIPRFVTSWLTKEQEKAPPPKPARPAWMENML